MTKDELEQMERDEQRRMEDREQERRIEDAWIEHERELDDLIIRIYETRGAKIRNIDWMKNECEMWSEQTQLRDGGWWVMSFRPENYSRDIAAAFELVEEAHTKGVGFDLANSETTHYETGVDSTMTYSWIAIFYDPIGGPACKQYKAEAPTPAEAISRAYLAWREAQKP
jgi:hypothetical protein